MSRRRPSIRRYSEIRGRRLTLLEAGGEAFEASAAGDWLFSHVVNGIDKRLLPLTKGRQILPFVRHNIGVLTTTGAKSGQPRATPLQFVIDGARVLLVASAGGSPRDPAWAHNLRHHSACTLSHRGIERTFVAREAAGAERGASWDRAVDWYQGYARYQSQTERQIPVFILEPVVSTP
jgi:deazaflavin-dependent oxidoreductase (nitroreductase family)